MRKSLKVQIVTRGTELHLLGTSGELAIAATALGSLLTLVRGGSELDTQTIAQSVKLAGSGRSLVQEAQHEPKGFSLPRRLYPKTPGQRRYLQAITKNDIVLGIGPAGTGKTYLAVAMAVAAFKAKQVKRIILIRPAVEAGERLGFLPGDIQAKIDPYLRPLYDALFDMIDPERFEHYLAGGMLEVAPLAFMRGRTLNDAFIILDEAQNTTAEQMKMFLTRMGFNSKVVVTGDITQIDLPHHTKSGLVKSQRILQGIEGIEFVYFQESDVVRHPLVAHIIKAYEQAHIAEPQGHG